MPNASPAYLAEYGRPTAPDELLRHACISFEGLSAPGIWRFEADGSEINTPVRSRLIVNTVEAALDAAVAGISLVQALSYQAAAHVRRGLEIVLEAFERRPWPAHLLYNGQSSLPLKLRAFIDFAAPRLRQRLADAAI